MLLEESEAALEVSDLGVGGDDVLEAVGLGVRVGLGRAQRLVKQARVLA